jgi:hypothetical protein
MERLTNEQLAEIRKRVEAATAGPWRWEKLHDAEDEWDTEMAYLSNETESVMDFGDCEQYYPTQGTPPNHADAEFISHARQDVPVLLAEIERLRNVLNYVNDLASEFFTEEHEDNVVAIPDSERHKQTMQEIFVVSYEAVNDDDEEL